MDAIERVLSSVEGGALVRATKLLDRDTRDCAPQPTLSQLSGRLVELTACGASAVLTCAFDLVYEAQSRGEPAAWVDGRRSGTFYPPDAQRRGVDLSALPVVRLGRGRGARVRRGRRGDVGGDAARAAERLLRSGAFALVVVDLEAGAKMPRALAGRLLGLAERHGALVLFVTHRPIDHPSIGPLISVRLQARLVAGRAPGTRRVEVRAVRDKRYGEGWRWEEERDGPPGLR
jgi:recombination protein RecA